MCFSNTFLSAWSGDSAGGQLFPAICLNISSISSVKLLFLHMSELSKGKYVLSVFHVSKYGRLQADIRQLITLFTFLQVYLSHHHFCYTGLWKSSVVTGLIINMFNILFLLCWIRPKTDPISGQHTVSYI